MSAAAWLPALALASAAGSAALLAGWAWDSRQRRLAAARALGAPTARGAWVRTLRQDLAAAWRRRLPRAWTQRAEAWLRAQGRAADEAADLSLASLAWGSAGLGLGLLRGLGGAGLALLALAALPWLRVREAALARRRALAAALPEALDLLGACVRAGLGLDLALQRVAACLPPGPLRQDLELCLGGLRLGKPRREAFLELEARAGVPELGAALRAVLRSEAQGAPLAPVLAAQAAQARRLRSLAVQKAAAQAPVKMLLPLMGFILPAVFVVIFGPILLRLSELGF